MGEKKTVLIVQCVASSLLTLFAIFWLAKYVYLLNKLPPNSVSSPTESSLKFPKDENVIITYFLQASVENLEHPSLNCLMLEQGTGTNECSPFAKALLNIDYQQNAASMHSATNTSWEKISRSGNIIINSNGLNSITNNMKMSPINLPHRLIYASNVESNERNECFVKNSSGNKTCDESVKDKLNFWKKLLGIHSLRNSVVVTNKEDGFVFGVDSTIAEFTSDWTLMKMKENLMEFETSRKQM
jgi:hypothetical protein